MLPPELNFAQNFPNSLLSPPPPLVKMDAFIVWGPICRAVMKLTGPLICQ